LLPFDFMSKNIKFVCDLILLSKTSSRLAWCRTCLVICHICIAISDVYLNGFGRLRFRFLQKSKAGFTTALSRIATEH
jgi:hypothetical protein